MKSAISERELFFKRLAIGDFEAFEKLFQSLNDLVYYRCFSFTRGVQTASQLTVECFARLWIEREQLQEVSEPASHFRKMCSGVIMNFMKSDEGARKILENVSNERQPLNDQLQSANTGYLKTEESEIPYKIIQFSQANLKRTARDISEHIIQGMTH